MHDIVSPAIQSVRNTTGERGHTTKLMNHITDSHVIRLHEKLSEILPSAPILSRHSARQIAPQLYKRRAKAPYCWIVNPLDGLDNISSYIDTPSQEKQAQLSYGTSVALLHFGRPVSGWIYFHHESKDGLIYGGKERGIFHKCYDQSYASRSALTTPQQPTADGHDTTTGSVCVDSALFLMGRHNFSSESYLRWKHDALSALVQEAGGVVTLDTNTVCDAPRPKSEEPDWGISISFSFNETAGCTQQDKDLSHPTSDAKPRRAPRMSGRSQ